jgi:tetratricopeptide (TPR) repeat protein
LPRAGTTWCATVEELMQVLPNVADLVGYQRLCDELFTITPTADAKPAYVRAVCAQLLGHAIVGAHEKGQACLEFMEKVVPAELEKDLVIRGYARLWRGLYLNIMSDEMVAALAYTRKATADLTEAQVTYRVALSWIIQSFCLWNLGDPVSAEAAARKGREIAAQIHDDYHVALADWYLGLALADLPGSETLDEAFACARSMSEMNVGPIFEATSKSLSAHIASAKGDWALAEAHGRMARTGLKGIVPYMLIASGNLVRALVHLGRKDEAAVIAREDLAILDALGGTVCSEVAFRVACVEALVACEAHDEADKTLREAVRQIERRAAKIDDPAWKQGYLTRRPENRRAFDLARARLGAVP